MEKKKITQGAMAALLAVLTFIGGVMIDDPDAMYCEDRQILMPSCDSLSTYYGLDNGKCNNEEYGNKLCRSG